jgi:hypothetical protein
MFSKSCGTPPFRTNYLLHGLTDRAHRELVLNIVTRFNSARNIAKFIITLICLRLKFHFELQPPSRIRHHGDKTSDFAFRVQQNTLEMVGVTCRTHTKKERVRAVSSWLLWERIHIMSISFRGKFHINWKYRVNIYIVVRCLGLGKCKVGNNGLKRKWKNPAQKQKYVIVVLYSTYSFLPHECLTIISSLSIKEFPRSKSKNISSDGSATAHARLYLCPNAPSPLFLSWHDLLVVIVI